MNNLLTTIILLCFSVAANADIYFCESSTGSVILADGAAYPRDSGPTWVVDTEKGIRISSAESYLGSCSKYSIGLNEVGGIICEYRSDVKLGRLYIQSYSTNFTFTETTGFNLYAYAGTCTKA